MKIFRVILFFLLTVVPSLTKCQGGTSSHFNTWFEHVPTLESGHQVQDSGFLCLCPLCNTPLDILRHIQEISCLPKGTLDLNGYYCSYNFCRLDVENIDESIIPVLFYIEADMDCSKSLILACFNMFGKELSSKVVATDDVSLLPSPKPSIPVTVNLFQYVIHETKLYVRTCQYGPKDFLLKGVTTSSYVISHSGLIQETELDEVKSKEAFAGLSIPEKWDVTDDGIIPLGDATKYPH